jgi:DNA-binding response OmpR family regulator
MSDDSMKKVLIVEDDIDFRNPLRDFLTAQGFAVSVADDGEQAIDRMLVHRPHLIILDLLLPKIHGFEVLKRIREYPEAEVAKIPVIILSNLASEADVKQGNALGVSAYFIKAHTSKDEILAKIKEILFGSADAKTSDVWDFTQ